MGGQRWGDGGWGGDGEGACVVGGLMREEGRRERDGGVMEGGERAWMVERERGGGADGMRRVGRME